ncbi:MbeD/MobD family mobilization/exclusion protein [Xenorhabdus sp. XENO-10]|uniref:MbeD/MobD family mobilization/exclusion protein n=2 Tax=Xenorhabdus yunnanensis TaxID=3025878 RepID=A0ABT5LJV8_9GAMM|nr:MbeD/MobD family mobilization/exclusion protein [Xenorhabdus yunnanensis]
MEQQFREQHAVSEQAQADLRRMFERTAEDNATLLEQVSYLSNQVIELTTQLQQFGNVYRQNR